MRIPLDYYRILGLPLAASDEQLRQAYSDRIVQLPRREYSQAAITSRKQLIEEAYVVLSNPKERRAYDQLYLAHAYGSDSPQDATVAVKNPALRNNGDLESQTLNIEIVENELVGAILILQELGEYELVLKLGCPYLINENATDGYSGNTAASVEFPNPTEERPDIVLTVALACLELGREQWQQGHYENAAISLETGEELLAREGLFLSVRAEIQADLYRLRPYRILELLALPTEKQDVRGQGLQLLQDILEERGGIDGTGNDQSGLNIDDFLRFIQQLRNHLTVAEQHKLFEAESKRPSAVATYLAVYALIARGFAQRQPALIRQAKQMLTRLGKRQDVHLEQSLCALLLGQTEVATRALELSQEYEALAFIRENSQDSPDLLPGLCLYSERWLKNEVFPHFQDLVKQQASLKDYFADQQVQTYLETLPTEAETTNESTGINRQSFPQGQITRRSRPSNSTTGQEQFHSNRTPDQPETPTQKKPEYSNFSPPSFATSPTPSAAGSVQAETPVAPLSHAERIANGTDGNFNGKVTTTTPNQQQKQRRRKRSQPTNSGRFSDNSRGLTQGRRAFAHIPQAQMRLLLMVLTSLAGILVCIVVVTTTFGWLKNLFLPTQSLQGEQLLVQLNQQLIPIPDRNSKPLLPVGSLTEATAAEIIHIWLNIKAAAFGTNHEINGLEQILVGSTLTKWQQWVQQEKADNRYRLYEHTVKLEFLETSQADQNHAAVEASVTEVTEFYQNGKIRKSNNEKLRVRYSLVRLDGGWRIQDMSVLNKISFIF